MYTRTQRVKQSAEEYDFEIDYKGNFPLNATELSSVALTATKWANGTPTTISDGSEILSDNEGTIVEPNKTRTSFRIKGGTNNYTYKISVLATFDNGAVLQDEVYIRIFNE